MELFMDLFYDILHLELFLFKKKHKSSDDMKSVINFTNINKLGSVNFKGK